MRELLKQIQELKNSPIKTKIDKKIQELKQNKDIFSELCFCLLTANFQAEKSIYIQSQLSKEFHLLPEPELAIELKRLGHRFPNARARYICSAREQEPQLTKSLQTLQEEELREWLVKNIKGLCYKESAHFLRNIGYSNYAIIDFHIIDLLVRHKIISKSKTLTKNKYLEIESILKNLANNTDLNLAELDFYLWYLETGKVLK